MKKLILILFFAVSILGSAQTWIPTGNDDTFQPFGSGSKPSTAANANGWFASLYTSAQMGSSTTISTLCLDWYQDDNGGCNNSLCYSFAATNVIIYLGQYTPSSFPDANFINSSYAGISNWTEVWSGNVSFSGSTNVIGVTLHTPFSYNNSSNLVMMWQFVGTTWTKGESVDYMEFENKKSETNMFKSCWTSPNCSPGTLGNNVPVISINTTCNDGTYTFLPIQLISFTGQYIKGLGNSLEWKVATQTNNKYFTIQSTQDGITWQNVTIIPGAGTTPEEIDYSFIDSNPYTGVVYYRLMQTDNDGKSEIFSPISVSDNVITSGLNIMRITNMLGQDVTKDYDGEKIYFFSNGSVKKVVQLK